MNPISRFIYWNMNYHVEHHMFPMVPYHALPRLHELIKHDLPAPNPSMWHAYREVWPVLLKQLKHEDFFLKRELPPRPNRIARSSTISCCPRRSESPANCNADLPCAPGWVERVRTASWRQ